MDWSRYGAVRWGSRPLGVALLAGAVEAGRRLVDLEQIVPATNAPGAYLLALIAFASASAGAALFFHGRRLFDRIEVSDRWKRRPPPAADIGEAISRAAPVDAPNRARVPSPAADSA